MLRVILTFVALAAVGCSGAAVGDDGQEPGDSVSAGDPGRSGGDSAGSGDGTLTGGDPAFSAGDSAAPGGDTTTTFAGDPASSGDVALALNWNDPFAPVADTGEGILNVSADLEALLENGTLPGACAEWELDPTDRLKKLLCGKSMFFFEGFDTVGVPKPLYDFVTSKFPNEIGLGFSEYGMVPNPYSNNDRPLGAVGGAPMDGNIDTIAFGCANCHFGQLPDGRYAVGMPNHNYDYGKHMLALMLLPLGADPSFDASTHSAEALAVVQPALDVLAASAILRLQLVLNLLPLLGQSAPPLSAEYESFYANWRAGTMDFVMPPLPLDDEVHTVSKIIDLWNMPHPDAVVDAGMDTGLLAWSGGATSVMDFLRGAVAVGGGDPNVWTDARLEPLRDYILSLRAPENPAPPAAADVAAGEIVFRQAGCVDCHNGPAGSGTRYYTYEEIGTDDAMRYWADPTLTGTACCGFDDGSGQPLTHGIKSPRLTGLWAKTRLLHNGSLDSLAQLLCIETRPTVVAPPYGAQGHEFGCDLSLTDREALVSYLLAH